jgi:hypothetical protein
MGILQKTLRSNNQEIKDKKWQLVFGHLNLSENTLHRLLSSENN